jgi:hypothetical protein
VNESSGNASLANDISVALGDAFSEAIVVGIQACDDLNDPLSLLQQKQIVSSCIAVVVHMRDQIECILELDSIARSCVGDDEKLKSLFGDIELVDTDIDEGKIGLDD